MKISMMIYFRMLLKLWVWYDRHHLIVKFLYLTQIWIITHFLCFQLFIPKVMSFRFNWSFHSMVITPKAEKQIFPPSRWLRLWSVIPSFEKQQFVAFARIHCKSPLFNYWPPLSHQLVLEPINLSNWLFFRARIFLDLFQRWFLPAYWSLTVLWFC